MGTFSLFQPFGLFRFSGAKPIAEVIYEQMLKGLGAEINFDEDSNVQMELYANAIVSAIARKTVEKGFNQHDPLRVGDLLEAQEWENGLVPLASQTRSQRRQTLAAIRSLTIDGKFSTISQQLQNMLGDKLVFYRTVRLDDLFAGIGIFIRTDDLYKETQSPITIASLRIASPNVGNGIRFYTEHVFGVRKIFEVGEQILLEPGLSRAERVTVDASGDGWFECTAYYPHDVGSFVGNMHFAYTPNSKRTHFIVLQEPYAFDPTLRGQIDVVMRRLVTGSSVWHVLNEDQSGASGPFTIGESKLGTSSIGVVTA